MKITDVKVETIRIPMKKPFRIAFAVQDHSLNVLVKISTDEGLWGIGEAAPFEPVTGESAATVLEALKLFRIGLIGMDPLDVEGIHRMMDRLLSGNTSAKAAVDIALYDIKGKLMGQPLYKVLGGSVNQIVTDMTVGIDTPEAMAAEARERVEKDGCKFLIRVRRCHTIRITRKTSPLCVPAGKTVQWTIFVKGTCRVVTKCDYSFSLRCKETK